MVPGGTAAAGVLTEEEVAGAGAVSSGDATGPVAAPEPDAAPDVESAEANGKVIRNMVFLASLPRRTIEGSVKLKGFETW